MLIMLMLLAERKKERGDCLQICIFRFTSAAREEDIIKEGGKKSFVRSLFLLHVADLDSGRKNARAHAVG